HEGSRGSDIKKSASIADRRPQQNKCAKSSDECGSWDEEWVAGSNVVVAAGEKMAEVVGYQDGEERDRERQAAEQCCRMLIEKFKSADKFVDGDGLVVREGHGKLR